MIAALSTYQSNSIFTAFRAERGADNDAPVKKQADEDARRNDVSFSEKKSASRLSDKLFGATEMFSSQNSGRERYGYGAAEVSREVSISRGGRELSSISASAGYAYEYEVNSDSISVSFSSFSASEFSFGDNSSSKAAEFEFEIEIRSDGSISFSMSSSLSKETAKDGFGTYAKEAEVSFNLEILADGTMIQEYGAYSESNFVSENGDFGFVKSREVEAVGIVTGGPSEGLSVSKPQEGFDPQLQTAMNNLESILESIDDAKSKSDKDSDSYFASVFAMTSTVSTSTTILAYQEY